MPVNKLYKVTVIKAHEMDCIDAPINIIILATDLSHAKHILKNCVRGYRRNKSYKITVADIELSNLPFSVQGTLLAKGYIIYDEVS